MEEKTIEKFPYLSPEWETAARALHDGTVVDAPTEINVSVNVSITPTPYGDKKAALVVNSGKAELLEEHVDEPNVTVKTDYETARELFLRGDINVVLSAMLEGKVVVGGDVAKLMQATATASASQEIPFFIRLGEKLQAITE